MGEKKRASYLDTICGILILHMIYTCHLPGFVGCRGIFEVSNLIFGFFMSWFFFKGGMFFKEKPLHEVIRNSNKRLLLPFAFFTIVGSILQIIFGFYNKTYDSTLRLFAQPLIELIRNESPVFSLANWFLLSLYVIRISYATLQKIRIKPIVVLTISILLSYAVYYICYIIEPKPMVMIGSIHIHFPFYVGNIFWGLAFYSLGHMLKEIQFHKIVFGISLLIYVAHFFYRSSINVRTDYATGMSPTYLLAVIYSLAGIFVFNNIFKKLTPGKIPLLTYMGKNSMIYYVTHYITLRVMFGLIGDIKDEIDVTLLYISSAIVLSFALVLYDRVFTKTKFKRIMGFRDTKIQH